MSQLSRLIDELIASSPPRAGSLAVTVFGDCIANQGGSVWLGALVECLQGFSLNAQQCRTAIFRLGKDGWIDSDQVGRRRYCRLSAVGQREFEIASARIYAIEGPIWDGSWTLVMPVGLETGEREALKRRMNWLGFAGFPNGLLAHPNPDQRALSALLEELDMIDRVVIWNASSPENDVLQAQVSEAWSLPDLSTRFSDFVTRFEPVCNTDSLKSATDLDAFRLRILLIHEYRRLILKVANLPAAILPSDWRGDAARNFVRTVYTELAPASSRWVSANLSNEHGALTLPSQPFYQRFGGIDVARDSAAA